MQKKIKIGLILLIIVLVGLYLFGIEQSEQEQRKEVTIITDKTTYERGEKIKITIKNNIGKDIWYFKEIGCGLSFWQLEKKIHELWKQMSWGKVCAWEAEPPLTNLPIGGTDSYIWDQSLFGWNASSNHKTVFIEKGIYRFSFVYYWNCPDPYQSRKDVKCEGWRKVYSNEFVSDEKCLLLEEQIKEKIEQANYCDEDSDCIIINKIVCPFGCYFLFNKNVDVTEIWEDFEKYSQNCPKCVFDCMVTPQVEDIKCKNNKCVDIRFEEISNH